MPSRGPTPWHETLSAPKTPPSPCTGSDGRWGLPGEAVSRAPLRRGNTGGQGPPSAMGGPGTSDGQRHGPVEAHAVRPHYVEQAPPCGSDGAPRSRPTTRVPGTMPTPHDDAAWPAVTGPDGTVVRWGRRGALRATTARGPAILGGCLPPRARGRLTRFWRRGAWVVPAAARTGASETTAQRPRAVGARQPPPAPRR